MASPKSTHLYVIGEAQSGKTAWICRVLTGKFTQNLTPEEKEKMRLAASPEGVYYGADRHSDAGASSKYDLVIHDIDTSTGLPAPDAHERMFVLCMIADVEAGDTHHLASAEAAVQALGMDRVMVAYSKCDLYAQNPSKLKNAEFVCAVSPVHSFMLSAKSNYNWDHPLEWASPRVWSFSTPDSAEDEHATNPSSQVSLSGLIAALQDIYRSVGDVPVAICGDTPRHVHTHPPIGAVLMLNHPQLGENGTYTNYKKFQRLLVIDSLQAET